MTVIGGGVAGYTAAIRAAQLGAQMAMIEKEGYTMETLKYRTEIDGKILPIPEHILERLDKRAKIEVVFRPIRRHSPTGAKINQVIREIEKQMDEEFPNLKGPIGKELANLAGKSSDIPKDMNRYTDREIIGMARMEKYLEKGEIIESLF